MTSSESKTKIEVKFPNFNEKFYPDIELDSNIINSIV